jgi:hypothetical protein
MADELGLSQQFFNFLFELFTTNGVLAFGDNHLYLIKESILSFGSR